MLRIAAAISVFTGMLFAQGRVAPENLYPRVLCVVPMIGAGTSDDPRRPMFVPAPAPPEQAGAPTAAANARAASDQTSDPVTPPSDQPPDPGPEPAPATSRTGIIGFQFQLTDDGKNAIVELVGADRSAFAEVLSSRSEGDNRASSDDYHFASHSFGS